MNTTANPDRPMANDSARPQRALDERAAQADSAAFQHGTGAADPHPAGDLQALSADGGYEPPATRRRRPRADHRTPTGDEDHIPVFDHGARRGLLILAVLLIAVLLLVAVPLHRQLGF